MKWNKSKDILALMVGHGTMTNGKWDPGATYGKYTEADLMLPIVKVATKMLRKSGVKVLTDADKGNNRNMISTVNWANKNKCKLYMSVHCDYSGATKGVAPLYKSATGKEMATTVGKKVAKLMGMTWKGAFKRTNLHELNATNMPAVIFETGCISKDLKYLKKYKKYGRALAKAICKYIGVTYVSKTPGEKLLKTCDDLIKDMNKRGFKYCMEYTKCGTSYAQAKKTKKSNCATYVSYDLQEMGILEPGQIFWICGDRIEYRGKGCETNIKKHFKITHPHKTPKKSKLQKGDVVGYSPYHTQVFAGWGKDKKGKKVPIWYTWGSSDVGDKEPKIKSSYNTKKIYTRLRLK